MASFLTAIRDLGRLREITAILAKYGFGEIVSRMGLASLAPTATQAAEDGKRTQVPLPVRVRQRPGVKETIKRDVELLYVLAGVLERSVTEARIYDPVGLVQQFDRSISAELDFTTEAQNAERFRRNFAGHQGIAFPQIFSRVSSRRVLTQEFFAGKKIQSALSAGVSGKEIAKRAVGIVIKMIFEDGFFTPTRTRATSSSWARGKSPSSA